MMTTKETTLVQEESNYRGPRGAAFWLIFLVLGVVSLLSSLEASAISTALPRIVTDLHGEKVYTWFITGYLITAAILMPIWGQLADIFGRRVCMIATILIFCLGSGLSGGSSSSEMLIGARVVQGIGGAGNLTLTEIIISDIVPLRERGRYVGIIGGVWALGTVIGPIIGGALSNAGQWRWIFYLNCPISGIAAALATMFLKVNEPQGSILGKAKKIDFVGSGILLGSLIGIQVALARGGVDYPWSSWNILVPLVVGFAGLGLLVAWISYTPFGIQPVFPRSLFARRMAAIGFTLTFLHGALVFGLIYILPIFFEGIFGFSALETGVQFFPFTFVTAPFAIVAGAVIAITGKYKVINVIAFVLMTLGTGLFQILSPASPNWHWIVFQIVTAIGAGLMFTCSLPPIQASVKPEEIAAATAMYTFMRNFGAVWGIAITTSIFNYKVNVLAADLPVFPSLENGGAFASSTIGYSIYGQYAGAVKDIAIKSLRYDFWALFALAAFGILAAFAYEDLHLSKNLTTEYGMKEHRDPSDGSLSI